MLKFNSDYYTEVDFHIHNYILQNIHTISHMTIRELADKTNVSTATILRFCKKSGFSSFVELKNMIDQHNIIDQNTSCTDSYYFTDIKRFFDSFYKTTIPQKIHNIAKEIKKSQITLCVGIGNSGYVASYAGRILSQLDLTAIAITEPYFSIPNIIGNQGIALIFSVSGETDDTITLCERLRQKQYKICAITNSTNTHLARLSDYVIDYKMTNINRNTYIDQSTQIPPILILEMLRETLKQTV